MPRACWRCYRADSSRRGRLRSRRPPAGGPRPRRTSGSCAASRPVAGWKASIVSWYGSSVENEAGLAVVDDSRVALAGGGVYAVELSEQRGCRIARVGIAVVRPRKILLRHRLHHVGRDDDHELGLLVDVVAALEQGAEDRQLHQARNAVDLLPGLLLDHAGHGERTAGGQLDGGLGAAGPDRGNGERGLLGQGDRLGHGQLVFGGELGNLGQDPSADASLGQHHRREVEADAELLELNLLLAVADRSERSGRAGIAGRDREFAAGKKARALARDGGQVRFGKCADHAGALHRAQRGLHRLPLAGNGRWKERLADDRKRIVDVEVEHRGAEADAAVEVDAELLDEVALHLGDRHLEHDLVAAVHVDVVDHLLAVIHEARGDVERLVRFDRARDVAGQHDAVAEGLDIDVQTGQRLLDRGAQSVEIALHRDVETGELLALGVEEEHAGLSDRGADDVGAAGRADDCVGDLRIGHQHVLDVARQVDHHRLADAERDELGARFAAHHLDDRRARVDRRHRGRSRSGPVGGGRASGGRQPEGGGHGNEQSGADQRRVPHDQSLCRHVYLAVAVVETPNRTTLTPPWRPVSSVAASGLLLLKSTMLRSASESVPSWRETASVSAWRGVSSSVAVLPITTRWPLFSSTVWSIASTRTLARMISLV